MEMKPSPKLLILQNFLKEGSQKLSEGMKQCRTTEQSDKNSFRTQTQRYVLAIPLDLGDRTENELSRDDSIDAKGIIAFCYDTPVHFYNNPMNEESCGFRVDHGHNVTQAGHFRGERGNEHRIAFPNKGEHAAALGME